VSNIDLVRYYDESYPPSLWGGGGGGPPAPVITMVSPLVLVPAVGATFTITGTGFFSGAEVRMGDGTYLLNIDSRTGSTQIVATALPNQIPAGPQPIWVNNGPTNGGESNPWMINGSVTMSSTKAEIVAWLLAHGVTLTEGALNQMTKGELMELVTDLTDDETPVEPDPEPTEPQPEPVEPQG
jgi:hypothetical protein